MTWSPLKSLENAGNKKKTLAKTLAKTGSKFCETFFSSDLKFFLSGKFRKTWSHWTVLEPRTPDVGSNCSTNSVTVPIFVPVSSHSVIFVTLSWYTVVNRHLSFFSLLMNAHFQSSCFTTASLRCPSLQDHHNNNVPPIHPSIPVVCHKKRNVCAKEGEIDKGL